MSEDEKLLMLAAKAEGREPPIDASGVFSAWVGSVESGHWWNPLEDDGDALRLAVKLNFEIERSKLADRAYVGRVSEAPWVEYVTDDMDLYQATRRAIVRAAAEEQRMESKEVVCIQCKGEGRVGGMDPAIGGKSCGTCDGTGMQEEQDNE